MEKLKSISKAIFLNPEEKRLRAGWRILIFLVFYIMLSKVLSKIAFNITGRMPRDSWEWWAVRGVVVIIVSTLITWLTRKFLDKKTFQSLGLHFNRTALKDFLAGLTISALMIGLLFATLIITGHLEIKHIGWNSAGLTSILEILLWFFGIGLAIGWSEELAFRGYLLQNMKDGMGITLAVIVSCLIYGLLHMSNPGSTIISGTFIMILGFVRIYGWLRTGQLWLSMGMHAGWDFCMGPVFGFSVSGMKTNTLITSSIEGKEILTGGAFGPEAGLFVIPVMLIGLLLMYVWTLRRKQA